jgi:hypothetical protein
MDQPADHVIGFANGNIERKLFSLERKDKSKPERKKSFGFYRIFSRKKKIRTVIFVSIYFSQT